MKNLRLTSTGKEGFLFRILFRGKKLNSPTPGMLLWSLFLFNIYQSKPQKMYE